MEEWRKDAKLEEKGYTAYEYMELRVEGKQRSFLLDGYENLGWEVDERNSGVQGANQMAAATKNKIILKRNRKISNKTELVRLQSYFEDCVRELDKLEAEKTSLGARCSLLIGIIGTLFMTGSVFAVTARPPQVVLCIILAVPAFLGWIVPFFLYRKLVDRETQRLAPLIEKKYDEIEELCRKGNALLYS